MALNVKRIRRRHGESGGLVDTSDVDHVRRDCLGILEPDGRKLG